MPSEQASEANAPLAYDILDFCRKYGVGRSTAFKEVAAGRLKAKKVGRRTIVLREDAAAWAIALPERQTEKRAA